MPVNDFKPFATGEFANVLSQPEYENLEALGAGFQSGIARSEELNKVWRQASTIASVVASFMVSKSGNDVLDNGNLDALQTTLLKALLNNSTSQLDSRYLKAASNLSELTNVSAARSNLGLKGAAVLDVGTTTSTVAAGNDSRIVNALQKGSNLADVTNSTVARSNLGLGTAAIAAVQTSKDDTTVGRVLVNGGAIALRSVRALAGATGNDVSDTNSLPVNSASFVYSTALNSPELTGTLLDVSGLGGSYNMQITAAYNGNGNVIKFRTYNGDSVKKWNPWYNLYHTGNKPTATDVGALPSGGTATASAKLATARTIAGVAFDGTANIAIPAGNVGAYTKAEGDNKYQPKGNYTPVGQAYTKSESDSRYPLKTSSVIGVRVSARGTIGTDSGTSDVDAPVGNFMTGHLGSNGDVRYGRWYVRALQININGVWRTITA